MLSKYTSLVTTPLLECTLLKISSFFSLHLLSKYKSQFKFKREAVEHFLTALVQQSQANLDTEAYGVEAVQSRGASKVQQMSETIWSTLRLALSYLNRSDLYSHCLSKDLDHLKREFAIWGETRALSFKSYTIIKKEKKR